MNADLTRVKEKQLAKMTAADLGVSLKSDTEDPADGQKIIDALDTYLSGFCKPINRGNGSNILLGASVCPSCDRPLGGAMGSFTYSIQHGEGACSCGWPCRANHYPKDGSGEIFVGGFESILAYHPDVIIQDDEEPTS